MLKKIIAWVDTKEPGTIFKTNDLLNEIGMNNNSFNNVKKSNKVVKNLFKKMETDKKGYYKVS